MVNYEAWTTTAEDAFQKALHPELTQLAVSKFETETSTNLLCWFQSRPLYIPKGEIISMRRTGERGGTIIVSKAYAQRMGLL